MECSLTSSLVEVLQPRPSNHKQPRRGKPMDSKIKLGLIYGSTREGRFCDTVAGWAAAEIAGRDDFSLDVIDPAVLDLPARQGGWDEAALAALKRRIGRADAFLVVTPEYNRGYQIGRAHV